MGGKLTAKTEAQGKRMIDGLTKQQTRARVDKEMGVEGAHKKLEALEKEVKALKKEVSTLLGQYRLLWKWKGEMERRQAQEGDK